MAEFVELSKLFMERFQWKHRVPGEPLDIYMCQPWHGDTLSGAFTCEICRQRLDTAYEVTVEWGDTRVYDSTDYLCSVCTEKLFDCSRNAAGKKVHQVAARREVPARESPRRSPRTSSTSRSADTGERRPRIKPSAARTQAQEKRG